VAKKGISGLALFLGTGGLYLAYIGIKDIPFFDGLRSVIRKERPQSRPRPEPTQSTNIRGFAGNIGGSGNDSGIEGLTGYARMYYPSFKAFGLQILGWGIRPNPSDHMLGKAMDIMHPTGEQAMKIIAMFQPLAGAKYWIWNRQIANKKQGWSPRSYTGTSPHTDHVHLSFD
jgi:hypothetical protein